MLVEDRKKIGRNSRCPCGSGLKYKWCCWQHDEDKPPLKFWEMLAEQYDSTLSSQSASTNSNKDMASIVIELADELLSSPSGEGNEEQIIMLVICVWNISLEPLASQESHLVSLLEMIKTDKKSRDWSDMLNILNALIRKKILLYPDNHFYITDFNIKKDGHGLNLQITYAEPPN